MIVFDRSFLAGPFVESTVKKYLKLQLTPMSMIARTESYMKYMTIQIFVKAFTPPQRRGETQIKKAGVGLRLS